MKPFLIARYSLIRLPRSYFSTPLFWIKRYRRLVHEVPHFMNYPDFPDAVYPAVVTHPISGRKVLEVVEQFLDRVITPQRFGLSNDESIELLQRLVEYTKKPEFHYFH